MTSVNHITSILPVPRNLTTFARFSIQTVQISEGLPAILTATFPPSTTFQLLLTAHLPIFEYSTKHRSILRFINRQLSNHFDNFQLLTVEFPTPCPLLELSDAAGIFPYIARLDTLDPAGKHHIFTNLTAEDYAEQLHQFHHYCFLEEAHNFDIASLGHDDEDYRGFVVYSTSHSLAATTIAKALEQSYREHDLVLKYIEPWTEMAISGKKVIDVIQSRILAGDIVIVDVSNHAANCAYEQGFAYAAGKKLMRIRYSGATGAPPHDTIGFSPYSDHQELRTLLKDEIPTLECMSPNRSSHHKPDAIWILEPQNLPDSAKNHNEKLRTHLSPEKIGFPVEIFDHQRSKLDFQDAFDPMATAAGVVVPFLSHHPENEQHNYTGATITGFAHGMQPDPIPTLLLQQPTPNNVPFDLKSFTKDYDPANLPVDPIVKFLRDVAVHLHAPHQDKLSALNPSSTLEQFGNTRERLADQEIVLDYFAKPPGFDSLKERPNRIIIGEKGSGKSCCLFKLASNAKNQGHLTFVPRTREHIVQHLIQLHDDRLIDIHENARTSILQRFWKYAIIRALTSSQDQKDPTIPFNNRRSGSLTFPEVISQAADTISHLQTFTTETVLRAIETIEQQHQFHSRYDRTKELATNQTLSLFIDGLEETWWCQKGTPGILILTLWSALEQLQGELHDSGTTFRYYIAVRTNTPEQQNWIDSLQGHIECLDQEDHTHLQKIIEARLRYNKHLPDEVEFRHLWWQIANSHMYDCTDTWHYFCKRVKKRNPNGTFYNPRQALKYLRECLSTKQLITSQTLKTEHVPILD